MWSKPTFQAANCNFEIPKRTRHENLSCFFSTENQDNLIQVEFSEICALFLVFPPAGRRLPGAAARSLGAHRLRTGRLHHPALPAQVPRPEEGHAPGHRTHPVLHRSVRMREPRGHSLPVQPLSRAFTNLQLCLMWRIQFGKYLTSALVLQLLFSSSFSLQTSTSPAVSNWFLT